MSSVIIKNSPEYRNVGSPCTFHKPLRCLHRLVQKILLNFYVVHSVLYVVFLKISSTASDDYDDDDDDNNYVSGSELLTELLIEWGQS